MTLLTYSKVYFECRVRVRVTLTDDFLMSYLSIYLMFLFLFLFGSFQPTDLPLRSLPNVTKETHHSNVTFGIIYPRQ